MTIMQMAAGMDTGDILIQREITIDRDETGGGLFDKLSVLGGELIVDALPMIERGELTPVPQDEAKATKCGKLSKDMGRIDFNKDAETIFNLVRGLNPWPSAFTSLNGKMLKIWKAEVVKELDGVDGAGAAPGEVVAVYKDSFAVKTGSGYLKVEELQLEGKKRMLVKDFLLGYKLEEGTKLG